VGVGFEETKDLKDKSINVGQVWVQWDFALNLYTLACPTSADLLLKSDFNTPRQFITQRTRISKQRHHTVIYIK